MAWRGVAWRGVAWRGVAWRGNTDASDARIAQAQQQMGRLAKLRVEARRTIGPKLTYLSSDFMV